MAFAAIAAAALLGIPDPLQARVAMVAGAALVLWLSEIVPPYVPTLALLAAAPPLLAKADDAYSLANLMRWTADPVLALFFGGFVLGAAASRHGIDQWAAQRILTWSRQSRRRLLLLVLGATAVISMWISSVAAAALLLIALRPYLQNSARDDPFRRALLLGVATGANFGGMATPIGAGPNGIAIGEMARWERITFVQWMAFAIPLTAGMLALGYALIARVYRVAGRFETRTATPAPLSRRAAGWTVVFGLAVVAWLTEPLHGVSAPVIGMASAAVLFGGGWLGHKDLGHVDWATLILIAGGLLLGRIAEHSGLAARLAELVPWGELPVWARVSTLVLVAALMGAVMSNTASAALLIPLALGTGASPSIAVLIALGTSVGVMFIISSPPNSMAHGEGLTSRDLLIVGLPLMIVGVFVLGLTGPSFLRWMGLP